MYSQCDCVGWRNFHDPAEIYGIILCGEEFPPTEFYLKVMGIPEKGKKLFATPAAVWDNKRRKDIHFGKVWAEEVKPESGL